MEELPQAPTENRGEVAALLNDRAQLHLLRGEYGKAIDYLHQGLVVREVGDWQGILESFARLGQAFVLAGKLDRAQAYVEDAHHILADRPEGAWSGWVLDLEAALAQGRGEGGRALEAARDATLRLGDDGGPSGFAARLRLVDALLEAQKARDAQGELAKLRPRLESLGSESLAQEYQLLHCRADTEISGDGGALSELFRCQRFAEKKNWPELHWQALRAVGTAYRAQGNLREAAKHYIRAMDVLKQVWLGLDGDFKDSYLNHARRRSLQKDIQALSSRFESAAE